MKFRIINNTEIKQHQRKLEKAVNNAVNMMSGILKSTEDGIDNTEKIREKLSSLMNNLWQIQGEMQVISKETDIILRFSNFEISFPDD